MELTNDFVIDRGIEDTWNILNDLEFIAPCMPGAQLTEIEGDEYRGLVKIKVGPITANYKGKASFVEQDTVNHVARLKAEGRDPRQGNANAMVTATLSELAADQTNVRIHTDLGLSGKIASFGRGAIEDVSKKILGQFVDNLRDRLAEGADSAAPDAVETAASGSEAEAATDGAGPGASGPEGADATAASTADKAAGGVRTIDSPEPEAVDLLAVGGNEMAKRLIPAGGVLVAVIIFIWWLINRG
jgi:carbon monoxide dehydrogenase subunit G